MASNFFMQGQQRSRLLLYCLIPLGLFPVVLMLINDSWVFSVPSQWIDPYFYTGYFLNLRRFLNIFPDVYYGARLPWLLLGFLTHSIFSPLAASYVLRLILIYLASFSLFVTLYLTFENVVGSVVAALLLSGHTYFLWAVGWDYVDGIGIALILMSIASLTLAARTDYGRSALILAGIWQFAMVNTYIILFLLIPFQLWWYLSVAGRRPRRAWFESLLWLATGWIVALVALCGVNYALSGRLLFFLPQLKMALQIGGNPGAWKAPNYGWVLNATWLLFPAISVVAGTVIWLALSNFQDLRKRFVEHRSEVSLCVAQLILLVAIFLAMEIKGFWLLQLSYYADYLIPATFMVFGAVFAVTLTDSTPLKALVWVFGAAGTLLASYAYAGMRGLALCAPQCRVPGHMSLFAFGAAALLVVAFLLRSRWVVVLAFLALLQLNVTIADARVFTFPPSSQNKRQALEVYDGLLSVRKYNEGGRLIFWYDSSEPLGGVFHGISSAYLWSYSLVSENFPKRTNPLTGVEANLVPGSEVAVLSSRQDILSVAQQALSASCVSGENLGKETVQRGADTFGITVLRVVPIKGVESRSCQPTE